jgi:hypothetical protein
MDKVSTEASNAQPGDAMMEISDTEASELLGGTGIELTQPDSMIS